MGTETRIRRCAGKLGTRTRKAACDDKDSSCHSGSSARATVGEACAQAAPRRQSECSAGTGGAPIDHDPLWAEFERRRAADMERRRRDSLGVQHILDVVRRAREDAKRAPSSPRQDAVQPAAAPDPEPPEQRPVRSGSELQLQRVPSPDPGHRGQLTGGPERVQPAATLKEADVAAPRASKVAERANHAPRPTCDAAVQRTPSKCDAAVHRTPPPEVESDRADSRPPGPEPRVVSEAAAAQVHGRQPSVSRLSRSRSRSETRSPSPGGSRSPLCRAERPTTWPSMVAFGQSCSSRNKLSECLGSDANNGSDVNSGAGKHLACSWCASARGVVHQLPSTAPLNLDWTSHLRCYCPELTHSPPSAVKSVPRSPHERETQRQMLWQRRQDAKPMQRQPAEHEHWEVRWRQQLRSWSQPTLGPTPRAQSSSPVGSGDRPRYKCAALPPQATSGLKTNVAAILPGPLCTSTAEEVPGLMESPVAAGTVSKDQANTSAQRAIVDPAAAESTSVATPQHPAESPSTDASMHITRRLWSPESEDERWPPTAGPLSATQGRRKTSPSARRSPVSKRQPVAPAQRQMQQPQQVVPAARQSQQQPVASPHAPPQASTLARGHEESPPSTNSTAQVQAQSQRQGKPLPASIRQPQNDMREQGKQTLSQVPEAEQDLSSPSEQMLVHPQYKQPNLQTQLARKLQQLKRMQRQLHQDWQRDHAFVPVPMIPGHLWLRFAVDETTRAASAPQSPLAGTASWSADVRGSTGPATVPRSQLRSRPLDGNAAHTQSTAAGCPQPALARGVPTAAPAAQSESDEGPVSPHSVAQMSPLVPRKLLLHPDCGRFSPGGARGRQQKIGGDNTTCGVPRSASAGGLRRQ